MVVIDVDPRARGALEVAVGGASQLNTVDETVISYLLCALSDATALEDDVVEVIQPFLPELSPDAISAKTAEGVARALRRELHGEPDGDGNDVDKPVRLARATRLGAGIGLDGPRRRAGTSGKLGGGNANQSLDRTAEAEVAKEAAEKRRARRAGHQPKTYPTQATVGAVKTQYVPGSKDVHIEGVDLAFGGLSLLEGASLHIPFGRRIGLTARNGYGKSTLMRAIARRELPIPDALDITFVEQEHPGCDDKTPLQSVLESDTVRQALIEEEKRLTLEQEVEGGGDPERLAGVYKQLADIDADQAEARAASILDGLGFSSHQMTSMSTSEFSGGWRMRIAIAAALFREAALTLLDEPSNHLDSSTAIWLANYLANYPGSLLLVSHDRELLNEVCTDMLYLKDKKLQPYPGNYDDFERARNERYKEMERQQESFELKRAHVQKFVDKFRFNAKRAQMAQSRIKMLARMDEDRVVMPGEEEEFSFSFPEPGALTGSHGAIQICNASFKYPGTDKLLLKSVDFNVNMQSRIVLLGPNGAGKSTIMKMLMGENIPTEGEVRRSQKLRIGYFAQHHVETLVLWRTPLEHMKVTFPDSTMPELRGHLSKLGVKNDQALRPINTLSGGQKSRVALSVITYSRPHILLMDEVSNNLDIESIDALIAALNEFTGGILLITHDARLVSATADEIWVCEDGKLAKFPGEYREYRELMKKKVLERAARMEVGRRS
jgi:ATP-binding cassette, subfamily F, member 3